MPQIISPVSAFTSFPLTRYRSSCIRNIVNIRRPTRIGSSNTLRHGRSNWRIKRGNEVVVNLFLIARRPAAVASKDERWTGVIRTVHSTAMSDQLEVVYSYLCRQPSAGLFNFNRPVFVFVSFLFVCQNVL